MGAEFSMKILENPHSNLLRQITEYHTMVEYGGKGLLLNRRGEWGQNLPPQLMIDDGSTKGPKRAYGSSKGPEEGGANNNPRPPQKRQKSEEKEPLNRRVVL